jgi:hypothetical protein
VALWLLVRAGWGSSWVCLRLSGALSLFSAMFLYMYENMAGCVMAGHVFGGAPSTQVKTAPPKSEQQSAGIIHAAKKRQKKTSRQQARQEEQAAEETQRTPRQQR